MKINKLSKSELAEGLTLVLVNKISLEKNYSPVQLQAGDEPCNILKCSAGFWVMVDGKPLKDAENKMIVWADRVCQIGRARYLLNYGAKEKEVKIQQLISKWKSEVRAKLDDIKKRVDSFRPYKEGSLQSILSSAVAQMEGQDVADSMTQENETNLKHWEPIYLQLEKSYEENNIIELMDKLGLKSFENPMLSARLDNDDEMKVVVNTFSASALDKWDGDMLYKYAQIEIEKQYPI